MVKKILAVSLRLGEILLVAKAVLIGYEAFLEALPRQNEDDEKRRKESLS